MSIRPSPEDIAVVLVLMLGIVMVGRIFWFIARSRGKLQRDQNVGRYNDLKHLN
jgi:hypothetical protein